MSDSEEKDSSRRPIEELITRYEFHPEMRDIYVEGPRDSNFLRWYLSTIPADNVRVYEIDTVEIDSAVVERFGVERSGNKGRVIALCASIDQQITTCNSFRGLVDKDFADFHPLNYTYYTLLFTDFACMESYTTTTETVSKFFSVYFGIQITVKTIASFFDAARFLYFARLAKNKLASDVHWPESLTKLCSLQGGRLQIDESGVLQRIAVGSGRKLQVDVLTLKVNELRACSDNDHRHTMNGHDFVELISWFARKQGVSNTIAHIQPTQRALLTSLEQPALAVCDLFRKINCWAVVRGHDTG